MSDSIVFDSDMSKYALESVSLVSEGTGRAVLWKPKNGIDDGRRWDVFIESDSFGGPGFYSVQDVVRVLESAGVNCDKVSKILEDQSSRVAWGDDGKVVCGGVR